MKLRETAVMLVISALSGLGVVYLAPSQPDWVFFLLLGISGFSLMWAFMTTTGKYSFLISIAIVATLYLVAINGLEAFFDAWLLPLLFVAACSGIGAFFSWIGEAKKENIHNDTGVPLDNSYQERLKNQMEERREEERWQQKMEDMRRDAKEYNESQQKIEADRDRWQEEKRDEERRRESQQE